eukprot:scaffold936_cov106-Amphora_coffeaeformis.AAC.6
MSSPSVNFIADNKTLQELDPSLVHLNAEKELLEELKQKYSKQDETPSKTTKVSLLSGFLGADNTTLLKRILRLNNELEDEERLRMADIVNDMGEINLDAEQIMSTKIRSRGAQRSEETHRSQGRQECSLSLRNTRHFSDRH